MWFSCRAVNSSGMKKMPDGEKSIPKSCKKQKCSILVERKMEKEEEKEKLSRSASSQLLKNIRTNRQPKIRRQQIKGHMDLLKTNDIKPLQFSL